MPLIDTRGRLFGRLNLIDAALLVVLLALVPLGVFAFRIFQEPLPRIDAVVPASQPAGPARRLRLKGANFRPYLRVFVSPTGEPFSIGERHLDPTEGHFLIESPGEVEIQLPPVAPGSYDLYVFDEMRQVLVRPSAFTIEPPRSGPLRVMVQFVAIGDVADMVKPGDTDLMKTTGAPSASGAVIQSIGEPSRAASAVLSYGLSSGRGTLAIAGPARTLDAHVSIPATLSEGGVWMYRDQPIRPGDTIAFETSRYALRGLVISVSTPDGTSDAAGEGRSKP